MKLNTTTDQLILDAQTTSGLRQHLFGFGLSNGSYWHGTWDPGVQNFFPETLC
jgi:hypothetical protein